MKVNVIHYGTIDLSKEFVISDPCYFENPEKGCSLATILKGLKDSQGSYLYDVYAGMADCGEWGERCVFIEINSIDSRFTLNHNEWAGDVGVDAGCVIVSDKERYVQVRKNNESAGKWYKENIIDMRDYDPHFIDSERTFYAPSGYGDGSYPIYATYDNDGNVIGFIVEFVEDESFEIEDIESAEDIAARKLMEKINSK